MNRVKREAEIEKMNSDGIIDRDMVSSADGGSIVSEQTVSSVIRHTTSPGMVLARGDVEIVG